MYTAVDYSLNRRYQNRRTKWKRQTAVGIELLAEAGNLAAVQNMYRSMGFAGWQTYAQAAAAAAAAASAHKQDHHQQQQQQQAERASSPAAALPDTGVGGGSEGGFFAAAMAAAAAAAQRQQQEGSTFAPPAATSSLPRPLPFKLLPGFIPLDSSSSGQIHLPPQPQPPQPARSAAAAAESEDGGVEEEEDDDDERTDAKDEVVARATPEVCEKQGQQLNGNSSGGRQQECRSSEEDGEVTTGEKEL